MALEKPLREHGLKSERLLWPTKGPSPRSGRKVTQRIEQLQREMQAGIAKLMGGESEAYSVHYRYDGDGRLTHTVRRIYSQEDEIETNYNDRGDVESEITRSRRLAKEAETTPDPRLPSTSEVRYGYQYDPQGNWIEKTASYGSSPDAAFQSSTVKRTLTYW